MPNKDKLIEKTSHNTHGDEGKVRPHANISNLSEIMRSDSKFKKLQAKFMARFFRRS